MISRNESVPGSKGQRDRFLAAGAGPLAGRRPPAAGGLYGRAVVSCLARSARGGRASAAACNAVLELDKVEGAPWGRYAAGRAGPPSSQRGTPADSSGTASAERTLDEEECIDDVAHAATRTASSRASTPARGRAWSAPAAASGAAALVSGGCVSSACAECAPDSAGCLLRDEGPRRPLLHDPGWLRTCAPGRKQRFDGPPCVNDRGASREPSCAAASCSSCTPAKPVAAARPPISAAAGERQLVQPGRSPLGEWQSILTFHSETRQWRRSASSAG